MTASNHAPIAIALVGIGKIARDQHMPALDRDEDFALVAAATRSGPVDDLATYPTIDALLAHGPRIDAVSICTPPVGRSAIARTAIDAGLHVMLEKPPAATLSEIEALAAHARSVGVTLFATWHSREANGVAQARAWLAERRVERARIVWKEDIRRWHPGQDWILAAGGFGIFDPGINALSIATAILPHPLVLESARMAVPAGRQSPIAATLAMTSGDAAVTADLDFLQTGPQSWDIVVETDRGTLTLREGGAVLEIDGEVRRGDDAEYPRLYRRFAELVRGGLSDVDVAPLRLVADAFVVAERETVAAFDW